VRQARRGTSHNRIALRMSNIRAERFLGNLPTSLFIRVAGRQRTNSLTLPPMMIDCPEPHLMGAALIRLNTEIDGESYTLDYIGIGGCGLVGALSDNGVDVRTTIVLPEGQRLPVDGDYRIDLSGPGNAVPLIGSRILTPVRPLIKPDAANPLPVADEIRVGDFLRVELDSEAANQAEPVIVEGLTADLTIPEANLFADHDGDGLLSVREIRDGTDPLVYDTDRDGLNDGLEHRLMLDPNDPDTDDDGILDGDETFDGEPPTTPGFGFMRARRSQR
jgi:hypothetical protein